MPRHSALWGLAFFALAFAPGVEAVVCGANEYLEMDGGWVSGGAKNAPRCTACPTGTSSAAGAAKGFKDSDHASYAFQIATAAALGSASNDLITWCDRDAGFYFTTDTAATTPGVTAACGTTQAAGNGKTTSKKLTCTAAACGGGVETIAADCVIVSNCAVNEYLHVTTKDAACVACPAGTSSKAGSTKGDLTGVKASITTSATIKMYTWCDRDEGSYFTTDTAATTPGVTASCGTTQNAGNGKTTSKKLTCTAAACGGGVETIAADCVFRSNCGPNEYLHVTTKDAACVACPTGMSSSAGSTQADLAGIAASITTSATIKMYSWCNVDSGYYLSTAASATTPGAATACATTSTRSVALMIAAATGVQTSDACLVEKTEGGPTGATGATGAAGAVGATGAAGAVGAAGAAGAAGTAGTAGAASPAAPLSTLTAAVFGAVVPVVLVLV